MSSTWESVSVPIEEVPNEQQQQHQQQPRSSWDEAKAQPLSTLFHYNIIMSPNHEEEEEGKVPAVAGVVDFDDEPIIEVSHEEVNGKGDPQDEPVISSLSAAATDAKDDDDVVSIDESILEIAMFEAVLHNAREDDHQEKEAGDRQDDDEELAPLPVAITFTKRPATESELPRPAKKAKQDPVPKLKPAPAPTPASKQEKATEEPKKLPGKPRRRRPNCMFVNHFGTRLNSTGQAVRVTPPVKNRTPARISSEESVSIKTKVTSSTGRSSKSSSTFADSKKTPVSAMMGITPSGLSPPCIPLEVRIVTPSVKKPVKSSCLEDITMEEDIMQPVKSDDQEQHGEELNNGGIPYINSISDNAPHSPMPGARMMPGMMPPLGFGRPFPLLQRRAFLSGCHPMAGHPVAFGGAGWHAPYPPPGMPFYVGPPPPTSSSAPENQEWKKS